MDDSVRRDPVRIAAEYTLAVHPACDLLPLMDDGALERLAEDVRNNGLISPIITHSGQIVDGRNRLIACRIAGVEPRPPKGPTKRAP